MSDQAEETQKGKIKKFVIYLLSESVLVIIGILLALQIDGYAEENAEIKALKSNLNYVIEDLDNNQALLQNLKEQKETAIASCTKLLDTYKLQKEMEPEKLITTLRSILITNRFENNSGGFERIRASHLYESKDFFSVRDQIREYDNVLVDLRFTERFVNAYITDLSLEMSKEGALFKVFDYVRIKRGIAQYKADAPKFTVQDVLKENKPLQAVLHKYEFDAPTLIGNYEQLLAEGEKLRTVIKDYLKK